MPTHQEVWKFPLPATDVLLRVLKGGDRAIISMPDGAQILSLQMQRDVPVIWARVFPSNQRVPREFLLRCTGELLGSETGDHVGTFQLLGGDIVVHVFERAR